MLDTFRKLCGTLLLMDLYLKTVVRINNLFWNVIQVTLKYQHFHVNEFIIQLLPTLWV